MKKSIFTITLLSFILAFVTYEHSMSQVNQEWVARYNGPGDSSDFASSIAVDDSGNVYVTGYNAGSGTDFDYATIKYNSSGVQQWIRVYNGPGNGYDRTTSIAVDGSGNVYVTGRSLGNGTSYDYATIKYNSSGDSVWVQRYDGPANSSDFATSIAIDDSGNVIVSGYSVGIGTNADYATIKYNSSGIQQWIQRYNGPGNSTDYSNSLAVDVLGNVYITGQSIGIGSFYDYATIKYNSSGVPQWVERYNGGDFAQSLVVDNSGNVYVTGYSFGPEDYVTIKYDSSGAQQWASRYDGGNSDYASSIAVDGSGNVYVTGTSGIFSDYATIKYNSSGDQQWIQKYSGTGTGIDYANALAVDGLGNVYVTGESVGTGTNSDFATIRYSSSGIQRSIQRYNGPGNGSDYARSLAVDGSGNVYVTGSSTGNGTGYDFATIKYSFVSSCNITPDSNISPTGTLRTCSGTFAPKATVTNDGWADQTNIAVTYTITGPSTYSSTKTIPGLVSGSSANVTFDSTFVPLIQGTYVVKIVSALACDTIRTDDTLTSSFYVISPDYAGPFMSCNYYFANSTPCAGNAPNQPVYYWEDTTGSISLIQDTTIMIPSIFNGNKDNGHFKLGNILAPGDKFRFCGVDYDSFFVTTNGVIGLSMTGNTSTEMNSPQVRAIPSTITAKPALFPFWKDFRWNQTITGSKRLSYKVSGNKLIITYDRVQDKPATLPTEFVSFQIILEVEPGPVTDGNIIFQYNDASTGAEFLNKYFNGALTSHTVGIQDQTATSAVQYRQCNLTTVNASGPLFNSSIAVAFGTNQNVLPVELISFTSTVSGRDVTLNWTTTSERNNMGFDVERSSAIGEVQGQTPIEWFNIGFVNGNGTVSASQNYSFIDRGLNSGKYNYRLKQTDLNGNFKYFNLSNEVGIGVPYKFELSQNYPNPFNPTTQIDYALPFDGNVSIKLFDISGREVAILVNEFNTAGYYTLTFNGSNLSSGVYFYRLNAGEFSETKRMMLVK